MREGCREGEGRLRYQHPTIKMYQNMIIGLGRKCKEVRTAFMESGQSQRSSTRVTAFC